MDGTINGRAQQEDGLTNEEKLERRIQQIERKNELLEPGGPGVQRVLT